jgi:two-component system invasion response regulator UvrY
MTTILIADDHAIVRKGLVQILTEGSEAVAVEEAESGEEALLKVRNNGYDLVLLDISLPGKSGLEVLQELKSHNPELPVLMLSMHPEEQYAVRALRAGASGYLAKGSAADELAEAIRKVLAGGKYISASLAEKLAYGLISAAEKPLHETLSKREYQVMRMIGSGKAVREIANELSLDIKTINTFRNRILRKLKMKSSAELTSYAIQNSMAD